MNQMTLKAKIKNVGSTKKLKFKRRAGVVDNAASWFEKNGVPKDIKEKFISAASRRPYRNETGSMVTNDELAVRLFILWLFKTSIKIGNPLDVPSLASIKEPDVEIPEILNKDNETLVIEVFDKLKALMNDSIKDPVNSAKEYDNLSVSDIQPMFLTIKGAGADPNLIKKIKNEIKKIQTYLVSKTDATQTQWKGVGKGGHGFGKEEIDISRPITWKQTLDFIGDPKIIKKGISILKYSYAYLDDKVNEEAVKVISAFSPGQMSELIKLSKITVEKQDKNLLKIKDFNVLVPEDVELSNSLWSLPNIMFLYLNGKESFILKTPTSTVGWSNTSTTQLGFIHDWIQNRGLDDNQTTKRFIRENGQLVPVYSGSGEERIIYKPEVFEPWGFGRVRMKEDTYEDSLFGTYVDGSPVLMPSGLPEGCSMMGDSRISGSKYPSKSEYDNLLKDLTWSGMVVASREYHAILTSRRTDIKTFINYEEKGHVVLDCGGGWYWVDLLTNQSSEEAKRMGHCGSEPSAFTLFSLRQNETKYEKTDYKSKPYQVNKSWATIGVLKDGTFIQFKGHGNGLPDSSTHPQIVSLLSSKLDLRDGFTGEFASTQMVQPVWSPYSLNGNPAFPKLSNRYGTDFALVQLAEQSPRLLKELAKKRPDFFKWKDSQGNLAESTLTRNIDATLKQEKEKTAKKH